MQSITFVYLGQKHNAPRPRCPLSEKAMLETWWLVPLRRYSTWTPSSTQKRSDAWTLCGAGHDLFNKNWWHMDALERTGKR